MTTPEWFLRELARWPRLRCKWESYRRKELIIPVVGDAYFRIVGKDGIVEHMGLGNGDVEAPGVTPRWDPSKPTMWLEDAYGGKWPVNPTEFESGPKPKRPEASTLSDGRFVIREHLGSACEPKVIDVVDADGRLWPWDSRIIKHLASRVNGPDKDAEREIEENAEAEKREMQERAVNSGLFDAFEALTTGCIPQAGYEGAADKGEWHEAGFYVKDRRDRLAREWAESGSAGATS